MNIYLINIAGHEDRRRFVVDQIVALGLTVEVVPAVTPDDFSEGQYEALYESWERPLGKGEIACFLSHKKLWQKIIGDDEPALILEDDAMLSQELPGLLDALVPQSGMDRVNLEARVKRKNVARISVEIAGFRMMKLYLDRSGSAGYVLWPSGAEKLLRKYRSVAALADKALRLYSLKSYQIEPAAVVPTDFCEALGMRSPFTTETTINPKKVVLTSSSLLASQRCKMRRLLDQAMVIRQQLISLFVGCKRLIAVDKKYFGQ